MATYTPNYGLHQWVPEDVFVRTDFNEDLEKIDTTLGMKADIFAGSYVGTSTSDGGIVQTIQLPKAPTAIFCSGNPGFFTFGSGTPWGFFLMQGDEMKMSSTIIASLHGSILQVANVINAAHLNMRNNIYRYVAFI